MKDTQAIDYRFPPPVPSDGRSVSLFLMLTITFSAIFWALMIASGHLGAGGGHYLVGLMWSPAVAAFVTMRLRRGDLRSLGLTTVGGRFALIGYGLPLAYVSVSYGLVWALGFGVFPDPAAIARLSERFGWQVHGTASFVALYFVLIATTGIVRAVAHALGEEIGWRGFLAPALVGRMGFTGGAVVTGVIWTAWHVPVLLFADYHSTTPWWFALSCFTVMVIAISVVLTWIRLRSNSVWPCAIFHASHNLFIQAFFTPLTGARGDATAYAIDEFGVAVPAAVSVLALLIWFYRRNEAAPTAEGETAVFSARLSADAAHGG